MTTPSYSTPYPDYGREVRELKDRIAVLEDNARSMREDRQQWSKERERLERDLAAEREKVKALLPPIGERPRIVLGTPGYVERLERDLDAAQAECARDYQEARRLTTENAGLREALMKVRADLNVLSDTFGAGPMQVRPQTAYVIARRAEGIADAALSPAPAPTQGEGA